MKTRIAEVLVYQTREGRWAARVRMEGKPDHYVKPHIMRDAVLLNAGDVIAKRRLTFPAGDDSHGHRQADHSDT